MYFNIFNCWIFTIQKTSYRLSNITSSYEDKYNRMSIFGYKNIVLCDNMLTGRTDSGRQWLRPRGVPVFIEGISGGACDPYTWVQHERTTTRRRCGKCSKMAHQTQSIKTTEHRRVKMIVIYSDYITVNGLVWHSDSYNLYYFYIFKYSSLNNTCTIFNETRLSLSPQTPQLSTDTMIDLKRSTSIILFFPKQNI